MGKRDDIFSPKQRWSPEAHSAVIGTYTKLYNSLDELVAILRGAGLDIPRHAAEGGMPLAALEQEVKNRREQVTAYHLGVPFSVTERASVVEERILQMLPDILAGRGITVGAIIQKNHGGNPDQPHEVLAILENGDDMIHLRDLSGEFGDYDYRAEPFALYATLYNPEPTTE